MCVCVVDERQKERKGRWLYLDRLNLQISNKTDQLRTRRKKYKDDEEKDTMFKCCVVRGEKVNEKDMRRVAVCILITKTILDAKLKTTIPIWFGYIEFKKKKSKERERIYCRASSAISDKMEMMDGDSWKWRYRYGMMGSLSIFPFPPRLEVISREEWQLEWH